MSLSDDDNSSLMIAILRIKKTTFAVVRISLSYYTENIMLFLQKCKVPIFLTKLYQGSFTFIKVRLTINNHDISV